MLLCRVITGCTYRHVLAGKRSVWHVVAAGFYKYRYFVVRGRKSYESIVCAQMTSFANGLIFFAFQNHRKHMYGKSFMRRSQIQILASQIKKDSAETASTSLLHYYTTLPVQNKTKKNKTQYIHTHYIKVQQ